MVAEEAVTFVSTVNRRTLDAIAARLYFYYSWAHESTGTLSEIRRYTSVEQPFQHQCSHCLTILHLLVLMLPLSRMLSPGKLGNIGFASG